MVVVEIVVQVVVMVEVLYGGDIEKDHRTEGQINQEPFARSLTPLTHSLTPLTRLLAPPCSLCSRTLLGSLRLLPRSWVSE